MRHRAKRLLVVLFLIGGCSGGGSSDSSDVQDSDLVILDLHEKQDAGVEDAPLDIPLPDFIEELWHPDFEGPEVDLEEVVPTLGCGFKYAFSPWPPSEDYYDTPKPSPRRNKTGSVDYIAHAEAPPESTTIVKIPGNRGEIVMPAYQDNMPLFERGEFWNPGETRCYELPTGPVDLTEEEAYDLYKRIAQWTTGATVNDTPGTRWVVGLRGTSPGMFQWNGNMPNRFNDTLILAWRDEDNTPHVLEFPGHTDTGAHDFGYHSSSSLWPNRRYPYACGWHRSYNALRIQIDGYRVRDDSNKNGHWDSDRNAWLPGLYEDEDHFRGGGAHNIHVASVDSPLSMASVNEHSAGCQNIPGMANWTRFITTAWTYEGAPVDYFLVDTRDIDGNVWAPCQPDGSHACPYRIATLPFVASGNTTGWPVSEFDLYNCSFTDQSGPEVVYLMTPQNITVIQASLDDDPDDPGPDMDLHLLLSDDPLDCLNRGNVSLEEEVPPGRYFIVVDTYVENGLEMSGTYQLTVEAADPSEDPE